MIPDEGCGRMGARKKENCMIKSLILAVQTMAQGNIRKAP